MRTAVHEPSYANFDDYRHNQRVVVIVRWFLLGTWAAINHWNATWDLSLLYVDLIGLGSVALNARLHIKLRRGEPIGRATAIAMSLFDIASITTGIAITNRFANTFFIIYYPALMCLALVTESRRLSMLFVTMTAGAYALLSITLHPGLNISDGDDRRLAARIMVMYALVLGANLIIRAERAMRGEAVDAERERTRENLELATASHMAELKTTEQRFQIRREIHDGLAQSLFALSLNIESTAAQAESSGATEIGDRLVKLIPVARHALLETRHYMHDLSPMLSEQGNLRSAVENLAAEFRNIADIEVDLTITDSVDPVSDETASDDSANGIALEPETATQICRIIQEALANVLKHSGATKVVLTLDHKSTGISLLIEDNGKGFDSESVSGGFGLGHIESRAKELGGTGEVVSDKGAGTRVLVELPPQKEITA